MNWDTHKITGYCYQDHSAIADMDSPPIAGDIAILTIGDSIFDVLISAVSGELLSGKVTTIGNNPTLEAYDVKKGQEVSFYKNNIQTLKRKVVADV